MATSFFDNIQKNLTSVGKQASEKAKEVATLAKLTAELHTQEQRVEEIYVKIGKRQYEATKDVPASEDLEDFNAVEACLAAIERLQDEIHQLKGHTPCPSCGAMNDEGSKFCSSCGEPIGADDAEEAEDYEDEE